jgi:oxygen-independent coproporphyrinogen-3 oxidase
LLILELQQLSRQVRGENIQAVYIGGGTPTAIPAEQLKRLLDCISDSFGGNFTEYTVEAGRPETLTEQMLEIISRAGVNRISINPQSMNVHTLAKCERNHSIEQIYTAYNNAKKFNIQIINMDLIAGLPDEDCSQFLDSMNKVIALNPENITIHSLAVKRAADFGKNSGGDFTEIAYKTLKKAGFFPYYLYRQSDCAGDNIGYSREGGRISLYNIFMTDESSTVLGAGCGAASRIFKDGKMHKYYNFKYPYEYISRFDEILNNRRKLQ